MTTAPITISNGRVEIAVGDARASAPEHLIEPLIRLLEASLSVIRVQRGEAVSTQGARTPRAPLAATTPSTNPPGNTYQRKSRKPVTPALVAWMEAHPGWRREDELLEAVVSNRMTDADPHRALKIALGKGRDTTFEADGSGRWRILALSAGGTRGTKRGPGRPRGTVKRSPRKRMSEQLVDWMRLNPGWRHLDDLVSAAADNGMTTANPNLAVRIALGRGLGPGIFVTNGGDMWRLGEDVNAGAEDASTGAFDDPDDSGGATSKRWRKAAGSDVKRARKNLLGISAPEPE